MKSFFFVMLLLLSFKSHALEFKSITPLDGKAGKWLITISAGLGMNYPALTALRNVSSTIFSSLEGGLYQHIENYDDGSKGNKNPSKEEILATFKKLREDTELYKKEHPDHQTMAVISIAGHGKYSNGTYKLSTTTKEFTGIELAKEIKTLGLDEVILIMQSCESGSLANDDFKNVDSELLAGELAPYVGKSRIVVITPASRFISSPFHTWENILLTVHDEDSFVGKDKKVITYEDWKNALLKVSCEKSDYFPKEIYENKGKYAYYLPRSGIDPQFYDEGVDGNLPMFLTREGRYDYLEGSFVMPDVAPSSPELKEEMLKVCQENTNFLKEIYSSTEEDVFQILKEEGVRGNEINVMRIFEMVCYNSDKFLLKDSEVHELYSLFSGSKNKEIRRYLVRYFFEKQISIKEFPELKDIRMSLLDNYFQETDLDNRARFLLYYIYLRENDEREKMLGIALEELLSSDNKKIILSSLTAFGYDLNEKKNIDFYRHIGEAFFLKIEELKNHSERRIQIAAENLSLDLERELK